MTDWRVSKLSYCLHLVFIFLIVGCQSNDKPYSYGTLERKRILLTAVDDEIVTGIYVKEGQTIQKGQLLLQLNDTTAKAHLQEAKASLLKAQAQLEKLQKGARVEVIAAMEANLSRAQAELSLKTLSFNRSKNLQEKNVESKSAFDKARAAFLIAKAEQDQIAARLQELKNGSRKEDIQQAQATVNIAKANVIVAEQKLNDLIIKATRDGIVEALPWHLGERVSIGAPVAVLLSGMTPFARIYIPETARAKIAIGKTMNVFVDGYQKPFVGKVSKIANNPSYTPYYALTDDERQRLMYLAEIQLDTSANAIPNGLPVKIEL